MAMHRAAIFAAAFLLARASCDRPPSFDSPQMPPEPAPVEQVEDAPMIEHTLDAPAEVETENTYCDTEHPVVPVPDHRLYAVWQQFKLTRAEHGIDGTLRVLQDSRFTGKGADRSGTHPMLPPCDALPGRLEIVDAAGNVVEATEEWPQIDVTAYAFGERQTVYQQKTLVHCLASCWCGDGVRFLQVNGGHIVPLTTRRASGELLPVRGVTRGCYEGGGVERDAEGHFFVRVHRQSMSWNLTSDERHFWDGEAWRSEVVERKMASK